MEPRPPRPRGLTPSSRPPAAEPRPGAAYPGTPPPPPPGYDYGPESAAHPPQGGPPGAVPGPLPLLPRDERRRRRAFRSVVLLLLLVAAIGAGGYLLRDRIFDAIDGPEPTPLPVAASPIPPPEDLAQVAPTDPPAPATATTDDTRASVLTPPTATALPAAPTEATGTAPADPGDVDSNDGAANDDAPPDEESAAAADRAPEDLLPDDADLPADAGLVLVDEGERTFEVVAGQLGDTEEATQALEAWGWSANPFRNYEVTEAAPDAATTTALSVSIHGFATPDDATEALRYFSDIVIQDGVGYEEVQGETIGDETRWLRQDTAQGSNVVAYLRVGSDMIRIGGFSPAGDPAPDVAAVAERVIAA